MFKPISTCFLPLHLWTHRSSPNIPPVAKFVLYKPLPYLQNDYYPTPGQVENIREGSFSSAPTSGAIFSANQPKRSYLQPPAWNHPRSEASQISYKNPPQYGENIQLNDNLHIATRLHLGELGYGNLSQQNSFNIFRILWSIVQSYDKGNLPHSVIARIELPGMWEHTRMLHNHWLQNSGTQQFSNAESSPQVHPPVTNPEVPPPPTQIVTINTPPDFSQSQQILHSTPLDTSFNAGSAAALQSISREPPPTTTSAWETAYNPEITSRSMFPIWAHERQEATATRNASPGGQHNPPRDKVRTSPQILSPRPMPMNIQPITMAATNNHNQSTTTVPLPRPPQNPINAPAMYQWTQPKFNQYPPYWGFPLFPPPGFRGASPQYSNTNPWNLGFTSHPTGGFQPYLGASNIPPNFPGGYAPNWPNNPLLQWNFPKDHLEEMDPQAHLGMDHQDHQETTPYEIHQKEEHHTIVTWLAETPQDLIISPPTSNSPTPNEIVLNAKNNC